MAMSCDFTALTISHHSAKFDSHTLGKSVNVANHENCNEFLYDDLTLPCDQRGVWVDVVIGQYFVYVTVSEALFWVRVGYFGWEGHYFGWVWVRGVE